ncbi:MAG: microcystin degradation protein MlrC [Planctomycetaceae bacterium]|nr:microcystin degradation protein MlrC [Planctomycetaceae bacterium]
MRIAIAEIAQETDSFSPMVADLSDFETYGLFFGEEILERMRGVGPLGGFLHVAEEQVEAIEVLPIIRAWAAAGGTITTTTLIYLTKRLLEGLKTALPIDALFLSLHGAASAKNDDDLEGFVLEAVRRTIGDEVPVVCPMDHHANITERMVRHANALVGHETQPHDPFATGCKAATILFRLLRGEIKPVIRWQKIPMITPQDQFLTSGGPMKEWFDLASDMESRDKVLDVSPYPMQPWLDVAEGGWSVVVHTDNAEGLAQSLADEMADKAWSLREQFWRSERVAPADAVRQAIEAERGLIILSDTGDSVYGGAPGDSTVILRELLAQDVRELAFVPVIDSEVLEAAIKAGVGAEINVELGGKVDSVFSQPVAIKARVVAVSKGVTVELADRGVCDMRRTALLEVGQIRIVVLDHRSFAINHPLLYTHLGLDINDAKVVVLKTASNFHFFQHWRRGLIRVDSPGMTQSDLTAFDWKRLPRPTYPLDELENWR